MVSFSYNSKTSGVGPTWYHTDHLGSTNLLTDNDGNIIQHTEYYPYGETRVSEGEDVTQYKFTGQEFDPETGLYYYGARYYDPVIGRFISADIYIPDPLNSQSFNRYAYCINNPLIYTDPTGHAWDWGEFGILVGSVLLSAITANPIAVGMITGAVIGGYSAYKADGSIAGGILFGATFGAMAGSLIGGLADAGFGIIGCSYETLKAGSYSAWTFMYSKMTEMGIYGAAYGAATGWGGGVGGPRGILLGGAIGAGMGLVSGAALGGLQYAHFQLNKDLWFGMYKPTKEGIPHYITESLNRIYGNFTSGGWKCQSRNSFPHFSRNRIPHFRHNLTNASPPFGEKVLLYASP